MLIEIHFANDSGHHLVGSHLFSTHKAWALSDSSEGK